MEPMSSHSEANKRGLLTAIQAAGGQSELARRVKLTRGAIHRWKLRGKIPAERVLAVEYSTGVSRCLLRPDLYPAERQAA